MSSLKLRIDAIDVVTIFAPAQKNNHARLGRELNNSKIRTLAMNRDLDSLGANSETLIMIVVS
jgi:hypothetical protein